MRCQNYLCLPCSRTDRWCTLLCTATNKKLVTFLFWTTTKTNYISKCSDFQKKLIDTITTSNFYSKFKEHNENDMAAQVFWAVYYSSRLPSQIGPTADFDGAAIPPSIFSMATLIAMSFFGGVSAHFHAPSAHLHLPGLMADIKCTFKTESLLLS